MTRNKRTMVGALLESHPRASEVLSWYGVALDAHARRLTLGQLCSLEGLDVDDCLAELDAAADNVDFEVDFDAAADDDWFDEE